MFYKSPRRDCTSKERSRPTFSNWTAIAPARLILEGRPLAHVKIRELQPLRRVATLQGEPPEPDLVPALTFAHAGGGRAVKGVRWVKLLTYAGST